MKVEYEWHALDECGRIESITEQQECQQRIRRRTRLRQALWCTLGVLLAAALAYSGYVVLT